MLCFTQISAMLEKQESFMPTDQTTFHKQLHSKFAELDFFEQYSQTTAHKHNAKSNLISSIYTNNFCLGSNINNFVIWCIY